MIRAILIISIALGTEAEFQLRVCNLRPSADRTFMSGDLVCRFHIMLELHAPLYLPWRHMDLSPAGKEKYYNAAITNRFATERISYPWPYPAIN